MFKYFSLLECYCGVIIVDDVFCLSILSWDEYLSPIIALLPGFYSYYLYELYVIGH
jgi:hypothetical protein